MTEHGHRYTYSAPSKGWPSFDADGRMLDEEESDDQDAAKKSKKSLDKRKNVK